MSVSLVCLGVGLVGGLQEMETGLHTDAHPRGQFTQLRPRKASTSRPAGVLPLLDKEIDLISMRVPASGVNRPGRMPQ